MSGASLRLFVALELPGEVRSRLQEIAARLRERMPENACRWVRPEGIHLTLKFLGDTPPERIGGVETALGRALAGASSLALRVSRLGRFGGRGGVRVVWVGLDGDVEQAAALAGAVDGALQPLGFPAETRPFRAHLTLARVRDRLARRAREAVVAAVDGAPPPGMAPFNAREVALMKSTLGPGGARYEALARFALG